MISTRILILFFAICSFGIPALAQNSKPKPEHFAAVALRPRTSSRSANVDIRIKGYSSDAEARELAGVLTEGGQEALLKALEKKDELGSINMTGRVGFYDFRLIRSRKTPNGRRIVAVSDRPLGFMEVYGATRSTDYTLGILTLDLHRNEKGKEVGQGQLIYAAKVKFKSGRQLEVESYSIDPVRLTNVRKY